MSDCRFGVSSVNYPDPDPSRKGGKTKDLYCYIKASKVKPVYQHIPKTKHGRNQHSKAFQTPIANTDVYKCSFFPQTIRDWNILPDSLISSAEVAEDSLVRDRD